MSNIITGHEAIEYAKAFGLSLNKYSDTTEEAREGLSVDEAYEVARDDPSLIYVEASVQVEAGEGEDYDTGRVDSVDDGTAYVSWDSGVKTPCPVDDLRVID